MELIGALSNSELTDVLDGLDQALAKVEQRSARHHVLPAETPRPLQGKVVRTMKLVLADYPEGLRPAELRALVEERLGRAIPPTTVRDALSANPAFKRVRYGVYRLRA